MNQHRLPLAPPALRTQATRRASLAPLAPLALLALAACSLESPSSIRKLRGTLLDSPIANLEYGAGQRTDRDGQYRYRLDSTLEFFIGDISLGFAQAGPLLSLVDLTRGANDETHPSVLKRARFLQTIDFDRNLDNGIQIDEELHARSRGLAINFDGGTTQYEQAAALVLSVYSSILGARELVSEADAQAHLAASLLSAQAGHYAGSWFRTVEEVQQVLGEWQVVLLRDGTLVGFALATGAESVEALSGTVDTAGTLMFSGARSGAVFEGSGENCELSGGWNDFVEEAAEFEGACLEAVDVSLGEAPLALAGTYLGSYVGADEREVALTIELSANGDLQLAQPAGAGTILSIGGHGSAEFVLLALDGSRVTGTISSEGRMRATLLTSDGEFELELERPVAE